MHPLDDIVPDVGIAPQRDDHQRPSRAPGPTAARNPGTPRHQYQEDGHAEQPSALAAPCRSRNETTEHVVTTTKKCRRPGVHMIIQPYSTSRMMYSTDDGASEILKTISSQSRPAG